MTTLLDGITAEDVQRINRVLEKRDLERIHEQMGQHVMQCWAQTCYTEYVKDKRPMHEYPEFLEGYIIKRYNDYRKANP